MPAMAALLPVSDYARGILSGDRSVLARAITLVESQNPEHRTVAQALVQELLASTGGAHRVGRAGRCSRGHLRLRRLVCVRDPGGGTGR